MAWRLEDHVVRGEIDNRVRNRVTGRIWLMGCNEPIELNLSGNAWRDLAGRRLTFSNSDPKPGRYERLAPLQTGVIGDCTASRKVKIPDVPTDELIQLIKAGKPFPWHWGNSLYLEWFSEMNGRVVIESATYQLTIADAANWEMSPEEEMHQRAENAKAMSDFMDRLGEATGASSSTNTHEEEWEPPRPMTEEEAETLQAESDRLSDRIQARLDREGPDADISRIIEEELERRRIERGDEPLTPEQESERAAWIDEMNRAAEEALAHADPDSDGVLDRKHPLAEQALELTLRLHREPEERGWIPDNASQEHPVVELINATSCAGVKLAGALNGEAWPPDLDICANIIVRLKRARGYIDDALLAGADCDEQMLVDGVWLASVRNELETLGKACDELIVELRERLERGID